MSDEGSVDGLHIDMDWKTEAAQEKERLAKEDQAGLWPLALVIEYLCCNIVFIL